MNNTNQGEVRAFLARHYAAQLHDRGIQPDQVPDDFDLFLQGVIDSLGLVQLVAELESHFGLPFDFEELDAEKATVWGALADFAEGKLAEARAAGALNRNPPPGKPVD